ncbi:bifunctional DNA primase/polymerase [Wenjunlia tyrosinilytica]|uniref:DNA primase n=1 Tax=Wenjunlia tyrosinilytica TaxID=1544741 RepID=A0A917ZV32_9ACTN|nr:bifunctional DNA primase/polymerase [Wenjunlia tyrosinilytica]GGO93796.1 DNA primase [Wenjunlia tyrosinilytica]
MGITLGDIRTGSRRRARATVCSTVTEYTGLWGWAVAPGTRLVRGDECSCGDERCAAPGRHPLAGAGEVGPGSTADEVAALWERFPGASALLPAGRSFDVLEVSEAAGCRAMVRLERMGTRLGPVLATPEGRAQFFVAPGAAAELSGLLYKMGWDDAGLDLRPLGLGDHVTAPPSELGGLGPVRWLRPPTLDTAVHPPEARLVLGTLAYACHRDRRPLAGSGSWLVPS